MDGLPSSRPLVNWYITAPRGGAGMGEGWQGIRGGEGRGLTALSVPPVDVKNLLGVRR